jgi:hypothetical protein
MQPKFGSFSTRTRKRLVFVAESLTKLLAAFKPRDRDFQSQRMCPYCGLITPRRKSCCLECGRLLKPA